MVIKDDMWGLEAESHKKNPRIVVVNLFARWMIYTETHKQKLFSIES